MFQGAMLGAVCTLLMCIAGTYGGQFLITAPSTMYRGSNFDVSVDILQTLNGSDDVTVVASLMKNTFNASYRGYDVVEVLSASGVFTRGTTGRLSMPIPRDFECEGCRLQVRSRGGIQIDRTLYPSLSNRVVSVLVQTDKGIYKPNQIVRYRALAVFPTLQIYNGSFQVIVTDPNGNKVQYLTGLTSPSGVVEGKLALSDQPLFGQWSLRVLLENVGDSHTQTFTVADYELPRFEVTVELPPYGLLRQPTLTGKVKAKYTFGQPVDGMVELHVGPNRGPNSCGDLPNTVQISFAIEGEAEFSIPQEDYRRAISYLGDGTEVKVTAFVKEEATGVRLNGSSVVKYHQNEYRLKFLDNTPNVFKPGLPYTAFLQVSTPDDMPPTGSTNRLVSVYTTAHYRVQVPDQHLYKSADFTGIYPLPGQNLTLPASGILPVDINIPGNATKIDIKATFGDISQNKEIENAYSPGNTFLQLTLQGGNIKANTAATIKLSGTEPLNAVSYMVLARGAVVASGTAQGDGQSEFTFDLAVTHAMAPTARLLAYYAKGVNEVVADSMAFNVEGLFDNEVSVNFSRNKSEPGQNITLAVTADPSSTVCVLAVDQSVLLLKTGNDITPEKVNDEVSKYGSGQKPSDSEFALSYSSRSTMDVFTSVGLSVISDVSLSAPRPPRPSYGRRRWGPNRSHRYQHTAMDSEMGMPGPMAVSDFGPPAMSSPAPLAEVETIRKVFPEAWLWSSLMAGPDGQANFQTKVPDTITSWVASAFATNHISGLGVAPTTSKLQVFRPFFVSLTYPNSVVRGEKVVVQATVFNYLGSNADVTVTLKASSAYSYLPVTQPGPRVASNGDVAFDISVASDEQGVVYFPLETRQLGLNTIEVWAQTTNAADGVRRNIYVQPEGAAVSYNNPIIVTNEQNSAPYRNAIALPLPPSLVPGSANVRVKVTGDLIGSSLESMTSLLALPTGCGEQSMVKFAPDLHIYRYLQATSLLTEYYRNKIEGYLEAGYQRQLTYQRYDGSFSAFGNRDEAGSTWLTAFVLKSFRQAMSYIYVDEDMLKRALNWLVDRQSVDGSFKEFGKVLDRSTQGTANNRPTLTAHVLLALLEARQLFTIEQLRACVLGSRMDPPGPPPVAFDYNVCRFMNATLLAARYLQTQSVTVSDQYSMAVISLALSKAGSPTKMAAFQRLQDLAREEGALEYWSANSTVNPTPETPVRPTPFGSSFLPGWKPPRVQARPLDVLITSYAILTYIELGQSVQAFPAVTWLAKQRNAQGGFVSTQDTTLALEALATYAGSHPSVNTNMEVKVKPQGSDAELSFTVNNDNAITLQVQQLPGSTSSVVDLEVTGPGMALVEFDVRFHVSEELSTPSFDVSTVLLDDDVDKFNLMVCTKWLWDRQTGMVVQEVSIPSGFEPDLNSMDDVAGMKKAERRGDVVEVYFDEITKTSLCYSVMMTRTAKVASTQKNFVRTYDYYSPADQSTVFYLPRKLGAATVCQVCDRCCQDQTSVAQLR